MQQHHKIKILLFILVCIPFISHSQTKVNTFDHQDTLRGSIGFGRMKWNVLHYNISINPDINAKRISGKNTITFFDSGTNTIQIDLQQPMIMDSIIEDQQKCSFQREGNVYWVKTINASLSNIKKMTCYFHGKPKEAINPPWDGGWIWKTDKNNNPWISVACQSLGASSWYPCKDTQSDEPDEGCTLNIIVPDSLNGLGNGRLTAKKKLPNGLSMYSWKVTAPINNYNIVPYIGKYKHFSEIYKGLKGDLDMDYWVLDYNIDKAKKQFKDATRMMKAFEYWFGPYPFYEDGYKLTEAPHLGMEHQSAIAYGNKYTNGYLGSDLSNTGWGLKWDFIIVHESGHEWFANNITTSDIADLWVHEGFTNYSETLFTEYYYGKTAANEYNRGLRNDISNDKPLIGNYGVNKEGSGDMYNKGGNLIHTIRQIIHNDKVFRSILTGLNKTFYHAVVTTQEVENYISEKSGIDFSKLFDQYLRTTKIPVLEYYFSNSKLYYRWDNTIEHFKMPIKYNIGKEKKEKWMTPENKWQSIKVDDDKTILKTLQVNQNFYIETKEIKKKDNKN